MSWVNHAIFWHVYPLGMVGAPIRDSATPAPRLRRLLGWLDYAVELGCSALLLGPIFSSQSHGYDTLDLYRIDPRLGGDEDFDELIDQCRQRGLRVVLDGVFSHVGREHPLLREALESGPDSAAAALWDIDWQHPDGPHARVFEGHESLVRFNHNSPKTIDVVVDVMNHWLARGAAGWRLDAAYSIPTEFWAEVTPRVRAAHPDVWLLGEVLHGDYAEFVSDSGIDSVTQYELWKAMWSSIKDRNLFELAHALGRHNDFLGSFIPNTFVGNHDVTRIASQVGGPGAVVALAILMTVGGIPSIYYGDEQGYTGVKQECVGGDDDIRPVFPDSPSDFSSLGAGIYRAHQDLIGLRRRHPWLRSAHTEMLHLTNEIATYRVSEGEQSLLVDLDLTDTPTATIRSGDQVLWRSTP